MSFKKLFLGILFVFFMGCSAMQQPMDTINAIQSCKFVVKDIKPDIKISQPKITLSGIKPPTVSIVLKTKIGITNTTKSKLKLNRMEFTLYVDKKKLTSLDTQKAITIPPKKEIVIPAEFIIDAKNANETLAKKMNNEKVSYLVKGVFYFKINDMKWPIRMDMAAGRG